ncbi:MAG: hypothetical protein ACR2OZ_01045 [Verrucomicrobiales bacterium]
METSRLRRISLAVVLVASAVLAAEPTLTHLYPVAGGQGATTTITATGKFDPWPPQVWVDSPGIVFKPGEKTGNFEVEIAKHAATGPHLVRFFNASGISAPRFFIVSAQPELRENEPNDSFKAPQNIGSLPATLSGRLDKAGDVDSFAVALKRGQTLVAWLEAYVLGSAFDGMLRIVDATGTRLAFNHDGHTLDPFLAFEAPHDDEFILQVMGFVHPASSNVQFTGGEGCVYRLHFDAGPFVRFTMPLAAQRGKKTPVELIGWNLVSSSAEVDCTQCVSEGMPLTQAISGFAAPHTTTVSDLPEIMEKEPNDSYQTAHGLEVPSGVTGRIQRPGDEDRFTFIAVKGRSYDIKVTAAAVGSPLDAWLRIEDKEGKELARNDDAGSSDPRLSWTTPSDGTFTLAVGDLTHRGGPDFVYRLAIFEPAPSVSATVSSHSAIVQPGKSTELKVLIKPENGFAKKLDIVAKNLPEGVSVSPPAEIPEKGGEITLKLVAETGAKAGGQPFQLVLREPGTAREFPVRFSLIGSSEDNGVPQGYTDLVINSTDQLWLTIPADAAK